jgi:hypothetical protein
MTLASTAKPSPLTRPASMHALGGRPNRTPRAFARLLPSPVRARIGSRSNSVKPEQRQHEAASPRYEVRPNCASTHVARTSFNSNKSVCGIQCSHSSSLDPPKFFHHIFQPLADPFKRRFGLVLARFRMVHRDIQFRIADVLDVTCANLYVLNRNALVKKNG